MKKMLAIVLVAALAAGSAKAQEIPERNAGQPRMMHGKHHHGKLDMKQLNLTEEQKSKLKSQREDFKKQMEELKKNDNITVKEWKARAEKLRKENKEKFDGLLTAEQKDRLVKMKSEQRGKMEDFQKQHAERMKKELGLSDEQSAKLDANRKEIGEKMKAIRENKSLNDDQKHEQMKEVMKGNKEKMKSILTEDQRKKMKEMHQHKPGGKGKPVSDDKTI